MEQIGEKNKMDNDLERGFVLRQDEACDYLYNVAIEHTKQVMEGKEDSDGMTEILDDLYTMTQEIEKGDAEYIKFVECPMSASNINIIPMAEKE